MIRLSYSFKLAQTKLRSKRAVLITSVIVASLLFNSCNRLYWCRKKRF
jgi:hypothetical protein